MSAEKIPTCANLALNNIFSAKGTMNQNLEFHLGKIKNMMMKYHSGLSTLKKYQCDSMGLQEFFHHSAIVSCITFHI